MKPFVNKSLVIVSMLLMGNLFFSSCNKDKIDPETESTPLISSEPLIAIESSYNKEDYLFSGESYQYDNHGRLIKRISYDTSYSTMEYSASTIIVKNYEGGELKSTSTALLNDLGLCTSFSFANSSYQEAYEYESDGYRKYTINEGDTWLFTYTYNVFEGNYATITILLEDKSKTVNSATVKEDKFLQSSFIPTNLENRFAPYNKLKSKAISNTNKSDFQFYTDKKNTIGNENRGMSFLGKQNKNPIKKTTYSNFSGSDFVDTETISFTYEYDAKGRITKQLSDDGNYTIYTYID